MGIIAAGQITVVDLSDAPVLNAFITASRPTTQTYSKDSKNYNPSYASTPQVLTLNVTKSGSTTSIIDSISGLHWFVVDGPVKTEITSKVNTSNEYISGNYDEILTTKLNIDIDKGYRHYEATGVWHDPSTDLDVQFSANINLLLTQNGATGPQGPQGDTGATGNGIANTVVTYGLSMSDTTEPATWSSDRPALVKGMYLWTRTVIIYTNGKSTTSYQISYIPKDADATAEIDKTKQELLEKLETVRDESFAAVEEAKQQLVTVRDESLAAAEEAKQQVTTVADDLSKAKTDFQNAVNTVDTKATNVQNDLSKAKQDLASQAQKLQEQANAQSELTNRVSSVEETTNGTKTTVSELSKTVDQNSKNITSVTARTKVVEDDLSGTKTTLSQVKTTADSTSQKAATLESGLNGLSAKFENLNVGATNLFKGSRDFSGSWINISGSVYAEDYKGVKIFKRQNAWSGVSQYFEVKTGEEYVFSAYIKSSAETDRVTFYLYHEGKEPTARGVVSYGSVSGENSVDLDLTGEYKRIAIKIKITKDGWIAPRIERYNTDNYLYFGGYKLERGNIATDYSSNDADIESKVAEYKQTADQNYASLSSTVQNLDGTVQHNKTVADQTAQGFTTRIESLETYKDGESTRANQYFELAKTETARQLSVERTAIAKDYVAKSTYTSDVTGIRNELSATTITANTTKQNLASYQASNDRVVANLQSNIQTANGDISSLKTKVEAVPGQITSAVSAVESKIPTSVGSVNLFKGSRDFNGSWVNIGDSVYAEDYKGFKIFKKQGAWSGVSQYFEAKAGEEYVFSAYVKSSAKSEGVTFFLFHESKQPMASGLVSFGSSNNQDNIGVGITDKYKRIAIKIKITKDGWIMPRLERTNTNAYLFFGGYKLERGTVATDWTPAYEDTAEQISSLSSQIKQTADGITLLATKTELNSAKNELQSGINTATNKANNAQATANNNAQTISTHTTQISALNTGLQAKVSQSDFNTLTGRVTTAENNIIAKANELSSKITSVEGKIPTDIGMVNLFKGSRDFSGSWTTNTGVYAVDYQGVKIFKTQDMWNGRSQYFEVKTGEEYVFSAYVKSSARTDGVNFYLVHESKQPMATGFVGFDSTDRQNDVNIGLTDKYKRIAIKIKITKDGWIAPRIERYNTDNYLYFGGYKLERGKISTDYSPAPEDAISQISTLSSELKQTQNGITLLATKTELSTAKNELQSGINTATNKANNAQTTANNNAQTIRTHTTQISALNTGLSAKVSQSDFNTLSGRVTTAENNITAKANELSSKITSVEGKIPTSVNTVNLIKDTDKPFTMGYGITNTTWDNDKKWAYLDLTAPNVSTANASEILPQGQFYNFKPTKGMTYTQSILIDTDAAFNPNGTPQNTWYTSQGHNQKRGYFEKLSDTTYRFWSTCTWELEDIALRAFDWYGLHTVLDFRNSGTYLAFYKPKLTTGNLPSDWSPSPDDYDDALTRVSSEIKQTADGITLLATKTELNSAKNELQSGINTATNKANNAQTTANNNAQTISTHTTQISALNTGLSAKVSQSDFNTLSGRVTTAENNITAKANELSSKITSVEGKIPTSVGTVNLVKGTGSAFVMGYGITNTTWNETKKQSILDFSAPGVRRDITSEILPQGNKFNDFKPIKGTTYTQSIMIDTDATFNPNGQMEFTWFANGQHNSQKSYIKKVGAYSYQVWSTYTWNLENTALRAFDLSNLHNVLLFRTSGTYLAFYKPKLTTGNLPSDWSPSPDDYDDALTRVSSEIKQTTDSIKASVQSLDNNTVKNSSLTINADGIVMKAGKSTTDVANAIGSYFAVNQNAINLFSDKIKVKGNMIVSGSISSDKIAASGITANVIKGGTLQSTNGSTNFELNTGKLFYNNNNTGVFRVQSGASTMGLKFSNTPITVNGTSRILSRAILGGDRNENTLDDGKWDKGGFSGLVIETIKGAIPAVNEHADSLRAISDTIYFTHTYSADEPTGVSAHGWKMETYAPDSSISGNIVLKPYGLNYRQSDIIVGDIRLDNGDGSGYWMRATINTLKACFGHILNGGTSSQALNAIRSELNKISGI